MPNSNSNSNSVPNSQEDSPLPAPWESQSKSQQKPKLDWLAALNKSQGSIQPTVMEHTPIPTTDQFVEDVEEYAPIDISKFAAINVVIPEPQPAADLDYNSVFANVLLPNPSEDRLLTDAEIPSAPAGYKAPVEVVLVEQKPVVTQVEYVSGDKDEPKVSEDEYYAHVVEEMGRSNPTEADLIMRLKLYQSQYVGLITTPEQACDHIIRCRADKVPIGGHEPVELPPQSTSLAHKQYIERRYAPFRAKKLVVDKAREDWKKAVAERAVVIRQWDEYVQWFHKNYNLVKSLPPESFVTAAVEPTLQENQNDE